MASQDVNKNLKWDDLLYPAPLEKQAELKESELKESEQVLLLEIHRYFESVYSGSLKSDRRSIMWGQEENTSIVSDPDAFMQGLIDFVEQKSIDTSSDSKQSLKAFLQEIYEVYFSYSPSIINRCSLSGLLRLGAKANRVPQIQGYFGQTAVGEITYTLAFLDDSNLELVEKSLEGLPLSEGLDVINFLQTVAADAVANGSWSRPALKRIESLLYKMQSKSESSFLDYAVDLSLDRIQDEKKEPTLGIITFQGNSEHGRLSERLQERHVQESDRLSKSIRSSTPLEQGDKYLRISQDAIAIIDRTNFPKYYGRIFEEELGAEAKIDMRVIERIKKVAKDPHNLSKLNLPRILDYININVMGSTLRANLDSPVELGALWDARVGILTAEVWTDLFLAKQKVDEVKEELRNFEYHKKKEVENKNKTASNSLVRKVYKALARLVEGGAEAPQGWSELKDFIELEDYGDEPFEVVESIFAPYKYADLVKGKNLSGIYALSEVQDLASEWKSLYALHRKNFQEVDMEVEEKYAKAEEERLEVIVLYNQLLDSLAAHNPALQDGLRELAEELENEMATDLPRVVFQTYGALLTDKSVNPFPGAELSDLPLLMQQLHRPLMRQQIEGDLGVSFDDFNLNAQVHLLQFLAGNNKETFSNIQQLLQGNISYKKEFLTSFLSCAGDYAFGDNLVDIVNHYSVEGSEKIFTKYAELGKSAEGSRAYLQENFGEELAAKPGLEEAIVQNLLKRGKELLQKAAHGGSDEAVVLEELKHSEGDLLLFANAFKRMYGRDASLEQFKELGIEHTPAGQLSQVEYDQMLIMADRNWDDLSKLMPQMYGQIMHDIPAQLTGMSPKNGEPKETTWHLMKRGTIVLGYFRLDKTALDTVYFGSMNSLPELHGFKLGDAILRDMLAKETEGKLTEAHASPKTAICRSYINRYGFVGTGLMTYYDTGEQLLAIDQDKRGAEPTNYVLKGKDVNELKALNGHEGIEVAEYYITENFKDDDYERFLQEAQSRFDAGKVLSAYHVTDDFRTDQPNVNKLRRYVFGFEPKKRGSSTEEPSPK